MNDDAVRRAVDQFVLDEIDSVPHLEALLMLWNRRPKQSSVEEMARALYVSPETALAIMQDLARRGLIAAQRDQELYAYESQPEQRDVLLKSLDEIYRRELVRISQMIHAKAPSSVRDFARAFRFTKGKE